MQNLQRYFVILLSISFFGSVYSQAWQYKSPMPTARKAMAVAVLQDQIWVMGGSQTANVVLNLVEVYDPATDTWDQQVPQINVAREEATAQVWEGRIFLFGGGNDGQLVSEVEMYDPAAGVWQTVSQVPTPRRGMASVVVD